MNSQQAQNAISGWVADNFVWIILAICVAAIAAIPLSILLA